MPAARLQATVKDAMAISPAYWTRMVAKVGINPDVTGNDFLKALRADALANRKNWQERLDVYLHGLQDCGAINANDAAELLGLASECVVPGPTYWNLTSPLLWILLGHSPYLVGLPLARGTLFIVFVMERDVCIFLPASLWHINKVTPLSSFGCCHLESPTNERVCHYLFRMTWSMFGR